MINFITSFLGKRLVPVTVGIILVLLAGLGLSTKLYFNELETTGALTLELKNKKVAYDALVKQLDEERASNLQVLNAEQHVEIVYKEIEKDAVTITIEECVPAPATDDVADLLCSNGLATGEACSNTTTTVTP